MLEGNYLVNEKLTFTEYLGHWLLIVTKVVFEQLLSTYFCNSSYVTRVVGQGG